MDRAIRKRVLRLISNGMYVLTCGQDGEFAGATITWLTQASFEPPLLIAGIRPGSFVLEALASSRRAVVHVLGRDQIDVAGDFFSRSVVEGDEQRPTINGQPFELDDRGVPVLEAGRAWMECDLVDVIDSGGDHRIVVLQVVDVAERGAIEPLTVAESPWEYGG